VGARAPARVRACARQCSCVGGENAKLTSALVSVCAYGYWSSVARRLAHVTCLSTVGLLRRRRLLLLLLARLTRTNLVVGAGVRRLAPHNFVIDSSVVAQLQQLRLLHRQ
jgi:hypothetical protein